ncbi:import inner membrane translocase subunit Tim44 [Solidesulfovibrio carbinoliphilus subsp. oakridgensis]|uniref:Import inner membrane translocase subunit Tim44 n=1 Tax=Solidesulfovibrio carbinoliphilus subsp. oakridgensis TaxID=694327 RepID=G7Q4Z0_9BACT|nr:Tim44-like domain-containing protein [Solidesulfovibrio carbinoliphilus]EHJ47917.1 import inner membrane translocase subunit Tim44 [Solidesulfovibrio carbinoliphilus subsp. oakridgensis]
MVKATGVFLAVFLLLAASVDFASAKRLGGGGSIGNRQSFSQTTRPDTGAPSGAFGSQQAAPRQAPMGAPGAGGGMFSRPGLGGMLGGLLVGGLVGSMLFGGGHAVGGGGPGLLDMLLIGGGLYLLYRFIRSRRTASEGPSMARTYEAAPVPPVREPLREAAANGWSNLGASPQAGASAPAGPQVPAGFDVDDFLTGAKALFGRLQKSWSARDLADIAAFSTPAFMEDVRKQAAADPTPTPTDVLLVDAKLLEVRSQGTTTIASAYFDTLLREDPKAGQPEQVREVWHFVRRNDTPGDTWRLDAIQQLDA